MEQSSKLRRKVLRGSLAAPVVLTVSSASAAAASFGRCLANAPATTQAPFFTNTADNWVRVQVDVYPIMQRGVFKGYFYSDPVKGSFVNIHAPYTALDFNLMSKPHDAHIGYPSKRWALTWLNRRNTSRYMTVTIQQPTGYSACTVSCYGSFAKA